MGNTNNNTNGNTNGCIFRQVHLIPEQFISINIPFNSMCIHGPLENLLTLSLNPYLESLDHMRVLEASFNRKDASDLFNWTIRAVEHVLNVKNSEIVLFYSGYYHTQILVI